MLLALRLVAWAVLAAAVASAVSSDLAENRSKEYQEFNVQKRYPSEYQSEWSGNRFFQAAHKISDIYDSKFRSPCAIVATTANISRGDREAFAVRLMEVLQTRKYRIHLAVLLDNPLQSVRSLKHLGSTLGVNMTTGGIALWRLPAINVDTVAKLCYKPTILVSIDTAPSPALRNIATHGIYIPLLHRSVPPRRSVPTAAIDNWLSYDQIWLPTWAVQADYNRYIMPFVEYATRGQQKQLWPVINSVVVPERVVGNTAFVTRALSLLRRGELEGRLRSNFHRIRRVSSPLPLPVTTPARYAAVIFEGRIHYALEGVCRNVMASVMPAGHWELHLFHSSGNERFVSGILGGKQGVFLHKVNNSELSIHQYNTLLTSHFFWDTLKDFERVLIFQVDSIFLQPMNPSHLKYDYIGAPWCLRSNRPARRQFELGTIQAEEMVAVGNGGFSVRSPASMLRCIDNYAAKMDLKNDYPEDLFFVQCLTALKYNIAAPVHAAAFAQEQPCHRKDRARIVHFNTTAMHALWYSLRPGEFEKMLSNYEQF